MVTRTVRDVAKLGSCRLQLDYRRHSSNRLHNSQWTFSRILARTWCSKRAKPAASIVQSAISCFLFTSWKAATLSDRMQTAAAYRFSQNSNRRVCAANFAIRALCTNCMYMLKNMRKSNFGRICLTTINIWEGRLRQPPFIRRGELLKIVDTLKTSQASHAPPG